MKKQKPTGFKWWLSRDAYGHYDLWARKPRWRFRVWETTWGRGRLTRGFCGKYFDEHCKPLKVVRGYCVPVKLIWLKDGIKLVKAGTAFKGEE